MGLFVCSHLGASSLATLLVVPGDESSEDIPCRVQCIVLAFIPILSNNVFLYSAKPFTIIYFVHSVFCLWICLAGYILRRLIILVTRRIAHRLRHSALQCRSRSQCVAAAFRLGSCCYSMYRYGSRNTVFIYHDCM